jgi:ubiquinone/menaquinone biosynthesis C-methylase UbiE
MTTPRFVARQLSRPSGFLGFLIAKVMNRANANINAFALQQLDLSPNDRVLEIGFGGGVTLAPLIERAAFVGGVDRSRDVIRRAKARFREAVESGRADFREGTVEAIPFDASSFDKVITVNTVYFWTSLDAGFAQIHRVLSPGGRAAIGFLRKQKMDTMGVPPDIFTPRTSEDVTGAMTRAGFREVRIARPRPTTPWDVVVASR